VESQSIVWCDCKFDLFHSVMVTYDEGDYDGGQEDGRPQGEGKMTYSETDPLGRLCYEGNWEAGQPSGQGCMKFR